MDVKKEMLTLQVDDCTYKLNGSEFWVPRQEFTNLVGEQGIEDRVKYNDIWIV